MTQVKATDVRSREGDGGGVHTCREQAMTLMSGKWMTEQVTELTNQEGQQV